MMWKVLLLLVSMMTVQLVSSDVVGLGGEDGEGPSPCVRVCSGSTG